jgi:hypothetical protein
MILARIVEPTSKAEVVRGPGRDRRTGREPAHVVPVPAPLAGP